MDLGGGARRLKGITLADWLWSTAFYGGALMFLAGAAGVIRPWQRLHRRSRRRVAVIALVGLAIAFAVARWSTPAVRASGAAGGIEAFVPAYHFRERHTIVVAATPPRVCDALKATTANDIALFNLFTWLRRFGRPGPESILNAPASQPLLDVATRSGFIVLRDRPPHEYVVGAIVVAPLARFTPYWRIIFPDSSILRTTWLRAIKTRAEKAGS